MKRKKKDSQWWEAWKKTQFAKAVKHHAGYGEEKKAKTQ